MFIPDSRRAIVVLNRKPSLANGSSRVADATRSSWPQKSGWRRPHAKGLSNAYIIFAAEDSLGRLQTDCIDLYQSHREDRDTALDETLHAYAHLMEQGNVRAIGASNYSAERLSYDWRWAEATNCQGMSASRPNIIFTIAGSTRKYSNPFA